MTPSRGQLAAAVAALDKPLWSGSNDVALHHLLVRLNTIWNNEVDHMPLDEKGPMVDDDDKGLRFFKDWTAEHIYPQNPRAGVAWPPEAHKWFHDAKFKRLHCLGNLLPLNGSQNSQAKDYSFRDKREHYEKGNNVLVRVASRVKGYEPDAKPDSDAAAAFAREVTFSPLRFLQRHRLLKKLLVVHVFGLDVGAAGREDAFYSMPPSAAPAAGVVLAGAAVAEDAGAFAGPGGAFGAALRRGDRLGGAPRGQAAAAAVAAAGPGKKISPRATIARNCGRTKNNSDPAAPRRAA